MLASIIMAVLTSVPICAVFYWLGARDLKREADDLRRLTILIIRAMVNAGLAEIEFDDKGDPRSLVYRLGATGKAQSRNVEVSEENARPIEEIEKAETREVEGDVPGDERARKFEEIKGLSRKSIGTINLADLARFIEQQGPEELARHIEKTEKGESRDVEGNVPSAGGATTYEAAAALPRRSISSARKQLSDWQLPWIILQGSALKAMRGKLPESPPKKEDQP